MGGDPSQGTVKGNEIACPFHDCRWGGDGKCKAIPYARRVPLRARPASCPPMAQPGILSAWTHPQGNPPPPDVTLPTIQPATAQRCPAGQRNSVNNAVAN